MTSNRQAPNPCEEPQMAVELANQWQNLYPLTFHA
jgi:hypothetical protein